MNDLPQLRGIFQGGRAGIFVVVAEPRVNRARGGANSKSRASIPVQQRTQAPRATWVRVIVGRTHDVWWGLLQFDALVGGGDDKRAITGITALDPANSPVMSRGSMPAADHCAVNLESLGGNTSIRITPFSLLFMCYCIRGRVSHDHSSSGAVEMRDEQNYLGLEFVPFPACGNAICVGRQPWNTNMTSEVLPPSSLSHPPTLLETFLEFISRAGFFGMVASGHQRIFHLKISRRGKAASWGFDAYGR